MLIRSLMMLRCTISMGDADRYMHLPGVVWEGKQKQMDDIYHLFDKFELELAFNPESLRLLITFGSQDDDMTVLNLGDKLCLDEDAESGMGQIGILRSEEDHHNDTGNA